MSIVQSVLMFCPLYRPIVGGAERQAEVLSKALVRRGIRVRVLTPRHVKHSPSHEEDSGVEIHRFPLLDLCKSIPFRGIGPLNLLYIRTQVRHAVQKILGDAQVVHTHIACPMSAFAMQAAQSKGLPVLCKAARSGLRSDLLELAAMGLAGPKLVRLMVGGLDCWVATTQAVLHSLVAGGVCPSRIVSIPNGVELRAFAGQKSIRLAKRFLYLGRVSSNAQRDLPTLVRAFDRVAERIPEAELAIVGHGDLFDEVAAEASKTKKAPIRMPGLQRARPWLDWADCFVLPSRFEGLSNALLEAMACGLPCIANDIPPNREVLDDGRAGILVPIGDVETLASAMMRLATEDNLCERLGRIALARVNEHYSIDAVADRYLELYARLLEGRNK